MRKYTAYIIAAIAGLCIRPVIATLQGYEYTINGRDLLNAVLCVLIVCVAKIAWEYRPRKASKPISKEIIEVVDDDSGVKFRIRLDTENSTAARKLYEALQRDEIKSMSFELDNEQ